jgi:hypothetical protein
MMEKLDLDVKTKDTYSIIGVKYNEADVNVTIIDLKDYVWDNMMKYDRFEFRNVLDLTGDAVSDAGLVFIFLFIFIF